MESITRLISIDRSSPVPLYFQVAQQLQQLIESGTLAPGTRLENEIALADKLGLSRPTMRQAMQHLVDKGLLARRRGVGTQVVNNRVRRQVELTSLFEDLKRDDRRPRTEVLSMQTVPAAGPVAAALELEPGTPTVALRRLRYANDEPIAVMQNHLAVRPGDAGRGRPHHARPLRTAAAVASPCAPPVRTSGRAGPRRRRPGCWARAAAARCSPWSARSWATPAARLSSGPTSTGRRGTPSR